VSTSLETRVLEMLRQSLAAWRVDGVVTLDAGGTLVLAAAGRELRVMRAEAGVPFRWRLAENGRSRAITSVAGLLRAVRAVVDPGHRPARVRIAPSPIVPP
jgi:hypothetical protein